jgi:hypothetical protein
MKAMLEPRIVAARIQGPDAGPQGSGDVPEWITPSSHGGFMQPLDASRQEFDSRDNRVPIHEQLTRSGEATGEMEISTPQVRSGTRQSLTKLSFKKLMNPSRLEKHLFCIT